MSGENWPDIQEFSRIYGLSPSTVRRRIKKGLLSAKIVDGKYRIQDESMHENLKQKLEVLGLRKKVEDLEKEKVSLLTQLEEYKMLVNVFEKKIK